MDLSFTIYSKTGKGTRALSSKAKDLPNGALKVLPLIDGKTDAATILGQLGKISEIDFRILLSQLEASGYIRAMHKQTWDTQDSDIDAPSSMGMVVEELFPDDFFNRDAPPDTDAEQATRQARAEAEQAQRQARQAEAARLKAETEAAEAKQIALAAHKARETEAAARRQAQEEAQRAVLEAKRKTEEEARVRAAEAAKLVEAERTAREQAERAAEEARVKAEAEAKAREEAERSAREERKAREAEEAARRQAREAAERAALEAERKTAEEARIRAEEAVKLMEAERAAREQAERAAEEARIKAEAEAKAREEAERSAREERTAREAEEVARRQAQEEAERAAQEAQRKADEDVRTRAEEASKLIEAERAARAKAERAAEQARLEAEQTVLEAQRKAEDEARTRAEEAARLEIERLAREQAERAAEEARAKAETEAKAREEAERSALEERKARIVEEAARRQAQEEAERIALEIQRKAEEEARVRAEEAARLEAERIAREQAEREAEEARAGAEQAARQEAERLARVAEERRAQEEKEAQRQAEAERKTQQEAARQARKAEEARLKAETDEAKRRAKEEARQQVEEEARQKLARKEQERADRRARKIAAALAKRNARGSGKGVASTIKSIALYLPLLLILLIGALHFINLAPLGAPVAKIASDSLGEPVQFDDLRASLFPQPQLVLSGVTIGSERDMKLGSVTVMLTLSTLFDHTRSVDRLEIMDASLDVAGLERPRTWFATAARAGKIRIAQVSFKKVVLAVPGLAPQPFDGRIDLGSAGEFGAVELNGAEHQLTLQLLPDADRWKVTADASSWQPPLRTALKLDELHAEGTIAGQKASFDRIEGRIYGGTFTGRGVIDWSARPRAYGSFEADNINLLAALAAIGSTANMEGALQTTATFATTADEADRLLEEASINAKFTVVDGKLGGVDLTSAMLPANREKSTRFDRLTGNLQLNKGVYHYRNLLLTSQQFNARGSVDVQENSALAGRISAELTIPSRRMQTDFGLGGTVGDVWMR